MACKKQCGGKAPKKQSGGFQMSGTMGSTVNSKKRGDRKKR